MKAWRIAVALWLVSISVSYAKGESSFSVDGVRIGDTVKAVQITAMKTSIKDPMGIFAPAEAILVDKNGLVTCITGSKLEYRGQVIAKRLQRVSCLSKIFGQVDHTSSYLNLEDDKFPITKRFYFREGCIVEVAISNNAYLHKHLPRLLWNGACDRIWRFRVWSLEP